jgi:transcriptional regulator with PAS, ATPase and Fis domain
MLQAQREAETALNEVQNLLATLRQLIETGKLTADFTYRLDGYENELTQLKNKWQDVKNIALETIDYYEIAQEEFKQVIREMSELE